MVKSVPLVMRVAAFEATIDHPQVHRPGRAFELPLVVAALDGRLLVGRHRSPSR